MVLCAIGNLTIDGCNEVLLLMHAVDRPTIVAKFTYHLSNPMSSATSKQEREE